MARKKPRSFTSKTNALLEEAGMVPWGVEARLTGFVKRDLYYMFDLVALDEKHEKLWGVQVTDYANMSARRNKIDDNPLSSTWEACKCGIMLIGWKYIMAASGTRVYRTVPVIETRLGVRTWTRYQEVDEWLNQR